MSQVLRALLLAGLLGCGDGIAPMIEGSLPEQRALWKLNGIRSYDYELTTWNEWFPRRTYRVEVRRDVVTRVVDVQTGESIVTGLSYWQTVDSLFARAERVLAERAEDPALLVTVRYDGRLHYPRAISSDHPGWADDSWTLAASSLVPR